MQIILFLSWIFINNSFHIYPPFFKCSRDFQKKPNVLFSDAPNPNYRKYPFSQSYFEKYFKRLNSKNITEQTNAILDQDEFSYMPNENNTNIEDKPTIIILNKGMFDPFFQEEEVEDDFDNYETYRKSRKTQGKSKKSKSKKTAKSDHFEIVEKSGISFQDVGGYDTIKLELDQCIDILKNSSKYARFNVRTPKGLIFEGPPGNGKTLLAKALAGEAETNFIAVSGAEFQDKYVGVGSGKVRELFELASENLPCIIFIDEIDALGRTRSQDGETAAAERDNTLNELLIALDGFKNTSGIFLIGATNRADLLDPALLRPGRIDKRIFIGNPDEKTREAIIKIHTKGKPRDADILVCDLVDITAGLSGAQIENLLNEAMLNALRYNREQFTRADIEVICNKILVGWQPTEHEFTQDIIDRIAIHEMGHAIVGLLSKHHAKVTKVTINLSAPHSPGYTVFESSNSNIYTRESLFEHLMILLGGRIAEEQFWGISVTTGAINDFEEVHKLAHKMITYYGMGEHIIYPKDSEKYKQIIDDEISQLIQDAYTLSQFIIEKAAEFIFESAEILKENKTIKIEELMQLLNEKYSHLLELKID